MSDVPGKYKYLKFVALCGKKSTHLLVTRRFFERSQRAQRRLLHLGETSNAGNIEPLIGPVATQGAQVFAALHIPDLDGPVIATTGEPVTIGTHLERLHRPLMGFSHPHTLPVSQVPPAQLAVPASTDQHLPIGTPGQRGDSPRMPRQGAHVLSTVRIPHHQFPASLPLAATPRGQPGAIG